MFSVNSTFLYGLAVVVIVFVLAQSAFFLIRAYKRGVELGIGKEKLKKTIVSTAVFTIAPAVSILIRRKRRFFGFAPCRAVYTVGAE